MKQHVISRVLYVAFLLNCFTQPLFAACPDAAAGLTLFSSVSQWQTAGANVFIDQSQQVLIDKSTPILGNIVVNGTLIIKNADIEVTATWIKVNKGGKLIAGSSDCPITNKVTFTLVGTRTTANLIGLDSDNTAFGSKGIAVLIGGTIQLYGWKDGPSWTNLAKTARAGESSLTLVDAVKWKAGDKIVLASTDFSEVFDYRSYPESSPYKDYRGQPFADQNEHLTVASVSGNVVQLTTPLNFTHWGQDYEKAEVGLLTRHIVVQGDLASETDGFGGHLMMRHGAEVQISGIEVTRMGQQGVLGRYPVHFHNMREVIGENMFVVDSSIHHNYQRCLVIHETHGITVRDNVAFNTFGHCYFLEDGAERASILDHNLGIYAKPMGNESGLQLIPTDIKPSIFWITNPNNTFTRNAAVSARFGYWFILPDRPINLAANYYPDDPWVRPRWTPLYIFENNVAHTIHDTGLFIDDMLKPDGTTETASYTPKKGPFNSTTSSYPYVEPHFKGQVSYKCRNFGVWGQTSLHFSGLKLLDNRVAFMVNGYTILEDSLIVGETDNVGVPRNKYHTRGFVSAWGENTTHIAGHSSYDNGGPQYSKNNVFKNFTPFPGRPAGALTVLINGPFMLDTKNRLLNLQFENANELYLNYRTGDAEYGWNVLDIDGSTTGVTGGAWITSNTSHLLNPDCTFRNNWNAYVCPPFGEGYAQFTLTNEDGLPSNTSADGVDYGSSVVSGRNTRATFHPLGSPNAIPGTISGREVNCALGNRACWQYMHNFITRRGYTIRFKLNEFDVVTPSKFLLNFDSSYPGDYFLFAVPYPKGTQFTVSQLGYPAHEWTKATSFKTMCKDCYYYDDATEHLYLMMWNTDNGAKPTQRWGFSSYDGFYNPVRVVADCPTATCAATKLAIPASPDMGLGEEKYQAALQTCQLTSSRPTENSVGSAYLFLYPLKDSFTGTNKEAHFTIYHDLTDDVTSVQLMEGAYGETGTVVSTKKFTSPASPVRGVFSLSHSQWTNLAKGRLHILVTTNAFPKGALRGQLQCKGQCSAPPAISEENPCAPTASIMPIYQDWAVSVPGWSFSPYSPAASPIKTLWFANHTNDKLCGNSSLRIGLLDGSLGIGYKNINVSTTLYKSLEFWVKVAPGYGEYTFSLGWSDSVTQVYPRIQTQHVQNYIIDEYGWTRVRVPLSYLNFTSPVQVVRNLNIVNNIYPAVYKEIFIDEFRFTSAEVETSSTPLQVNIPQYDADICSNLGLPTVEDDENLSSASVRSGSALLIIALLAVLFR